VGDVRCHSRSSWSSLAPWRRNKIVEGGEGDVVEGEDMKERWEGEVETGWGRDGESSVCS
jgi:hypothetical protein